MACPADSCAGSRIQLAGQCSGLGADTRIRPAMDPRRAEYLFPAQVVQSFRGHIRQPGRRIGQAIHTHLPRTGGLRMLGLAHAWPGGVVRPGRDHWARSPGQRLLGRGHWLRRGVLRNGDGYGALPNATDPDGVIPPPGPCSWRVVPPPGAVGYGQWSEGRVQPECSGVIGVSGEPPPQRIVKEVNFPGTEQEVISRLAEQFPATRCASEFACQRSRARRSRGVRVCAEEERSWLVSKPAGECDRLPRLFDPIAGARRCVI